MTAKIHTSHSSTNGRIGLTFDTLNNSILGPTMVLSGDHNVGIGVDPPSQKLSVAGVVQSTSGGFQFPDGTTQITAAGGGLSGSGSANYLPKFTRGTTIGNSRIYDDGGATINVGGQLKVEGDRIRSSANYEVFRWDPTTTNVEVLGQKMSTAKVETTNLTVINSPNFSSNRIQGSDNLYPISWMTNGGNTTVSIGGGTAWGHTFQNSYNLFVYGSFSASQKFFDIPHPLDLEHKRLVHSTLEGPEVGVYYRGTDQLINGKAEITLPVYFESLTRKENRSVLLTNLDGFDRLAVRTANNAQIENGKFVVYSDNPQSNQKFNWEVKAVRADVPILEAERWKTGSGL